MIPQIGSTISFTAYNSELKSLFKKGKMPSVTHGIYGDPIDADTVSLEHLEPHSLGGKTELGNLALANKFKNSKRGNNPLHWFLNWAMVEEYLSQFNFSIKGFDGFSYQDKIRKTCKRLGVKIDFYI